MFHSRASGIDLHAPSNQVIHNDSETFIIKGTVVKIVGVLEDGTPKVVPANTGDVPFGVIWDDTLKSKLGLVCVLGIFPFENSATPGSPISFDDLGQLSTIVTGSYNIGKTLSDKFIQLNFSAIELSTSGWDTQGNVLSDDEKVLGSLNNKDVSIISNGSLRTFYSKTGIVRFGDKNVVQDFKFQFSNNIPHHSGLLLDNFSAVNSLNSYLTIWTHDIPESTLQTFNVHLIAKLDNKKAIFDYTVTVSRDEGLAVIHHIQTDYQTKLGNPSFKVKFLINMTTLKIEVSNESELGTVWSGYVQCHASL